VKAVEPFGTEMLERPGTRSDNRTPHPDRSIATPRRIRRARTVVKAWMRRPRNLNAACSASSEDRTWPEDVAPSDEADYVSNGPPHAERTENKGGLR